MSKNVDLSDEFDSSSDINELEGKLKCRESTETFSAESTLKVHLDIKNDINDSLSILEVDENRNVEEDLNTQIDAAHEGKKSHECEHCHEGFADEQFLKSHMESNCEKIKIKKLKIQSINQDKKSFKIMVTTIMPFGIIS